HHFAIFSAIEDRAVDGDDAALHALDFLADIAPGGAHVAGVLPEMSAAAIGSQGNAGQARIGGGILALEADEAVVFAGDDALAIAALAAVVNADRENLGLDPA